MGGKQSWYFHPFKAHLGCVPVILGIHVDRILLHEMSLLLDLSEIKVGNCIVTVKDASNLLKSGTLGLDVKVVDKDELDSVPEGVEEHKIPVVREVAPRQLVGLVGNSQDSLHNNIHNHHTLGAKMEGENLEGVTDKETRETNVVKDTKDPDKGNLCIARARVSICDLAFGVSHGRVLVDCTDDGPQSKRGHHSRDGDQEERTTTEFVNSKSSTDRDGKIQNGLASRESKFIILLGDSSTLVDNVDVVGEEGVARLLRNDTQ